MLNDRKSKEEIDLLVELNETKVILKGTKGVVEEYHRDNIALKKREQELEKRLSDMSAHLDECHRTIKNLETRLAESLEVNESHHKLNGKLQVRLTEVEEDNKKLSLQISNYIKQQEDKIRKLGL
tara:strand:+ start:272 stop:646 length:375 start_codon:yes stop_codon:yes gene_type:complete